MVLVILASSYHELVIVALLHVLRFWLHFCIVAGSEASLSIFIYVSGLDQSDDKTNGSILGALTFVICEIRVKLFKDETK